MTEKKDAYVQKLHAKIDEWNADIDKLAAKARQTEADSKARYEKEIGDLKEKRRELEEKLARVQQAGDGAWEDLKAGIDLAWTALDTAVKSAVSRFK